MEGSASRAVGSVLSPRALHASPAVGAEEDAAEDIGMSRFARLPFRRLGGRSEPAANLLEQVVRDECFVCCPRSADPIGLFAPAHADLVPGSDVVGVHQLLDLLLHGPDPPAGVRLVHQDGPNSRMGPASGIPMGLRRGSCALGEGTPSSVSACAMAR